MNYIKNNDISINIGIAIKNNSNDLFNILLFSFLEQMDISIIPTIPPRVFMMISVISETPM